MRSIILALAFLASVLVTRQPCRAAEVTIRFPLEGHYREGRYLPVRLDAKDVGTTVEIDADGAIPTKIRFGDGVAGATVPLLSTGGAIANARWRAGGGASGQVPNPPKPLEADERLVAFAGEEPSQGAAAALFPGMKIVPVRLDPTRRLAPAVAYEAMDALVMSEAVSANNTILGEAEVRALLAAGTVVAVRSEASFPAPWQRRGGFWVLHHKPAGPNGTVVPEAYEPTYGWPRGWPRAVRVRAVLLVAIASIAAIAAGLWRSRWAVVLSAGVSLLGAGGIALWGAGRPPVARVGGTILTRGATAGASFTQRDRWTYHLPLRDAQTSMPFANLTRPVFFGRRQIAQLKEAGLHLACDTDGSPARFIVRLEAKASLAFISRSVASDGAPASIPSIPVTSQLHGLANRTYPGRIVGQTEPEPGEDVDVARTAASEERRPAHGLEARVTGFSTHHVVCVPLPCPLRRSVRSQPPYAATSPRPLPHPRPRRYTSPRLELSRRIHPGASRVASG